MNCPYCQSELHAEALVCKTCKKDLYLLKPLMAKIATLEDQLKAVPDVTAFEAKILLLEQQLEAALAPPEPAQKSLKSNLVSWCLFIVLPLCILLVAHGLIVVVYDTKLIYLRLLSILIPLPFGYFLFVRQDRSLVAWFFGVLSLAIASVIGMSWLTSLVDKTPIFPQNAFEWREFLEYAASISFSFLTGMVLGRMVFAQANSRLSTPIVKAVVSGLNGKNLSPDRVNGLVRKLNEYGSSVVALGSTGLAIYTGLKGVL